MAAASTILSDLPRHVRDAVRFYWQTRTKQLEKQAGSGTKDQGLRSAVTGGCTLHGSRRSLAAAPFPSPPLEERVRERRSSSSASTPNILVQQPAEMSPRTTSSRMGLLSPSLSSKGGEGELLARRSPLQDACKVQTGGAQMDGFIELLTKLSRKQADYIGVPVEGPYKPDHYRY